MWEKLKIFTLGVVVSSIVTIFVASNFLITPSATTVSSEEGASITYHANVCKKVTRADGTVEDLGCSKNIFTNAGKNHTRDQLTGIIGSTTTLMDDIAVANVSGGAGCTAQTDDDTTLCGEYTTCGLGRTSVANTFVRANASALPVAGNWTVGGEFTSTCATQPVNGTGLFNATSGGTLFALNTFTTATLETNDKINITWFIWLT